MIVISLDRWPKEVQTELLKRMGKYQAGKKLSFQGSLAEAERFYREVCEIVGGPQAEINTGAVKNDTGTSGALPAFITPLHQYCYFSHAYKKEINQIQDKFGVKIDAEVSVSVTAEDQTRPDSVRKASDELMDLYQTSTTSLQSVSILQTQLDSKIVKDLVHNIQSDQAKIALMMSADGCVLSGPKNTLSEVQSQLNSEDSGEVASRQMSKTSKLRFDPILMSDTRWRLMKKRFEKQLLDIEQKYGVQFCDERSHDCHTKVTIQSRDNQPVNQESHALRAFMQLYLEVVLSAVSVFDQESTVTQIKTKYLLHPKQWALNATRPRSKSSTKTVEKTRDDLRQVVSVNSEQKDSDKSKYDDECPICINKCTDQVKLKCGHGFCRDCLKMSIKIFGEMCPVCKKIYGKVKGNQPQGTMSCRTHRYDLPGYYGCGTNEIYYDIPGGKQTDEHPNPGQPYSGARRQAYLPSNTEGKEVLQLLQRAFDQRLIFTVGTSMFTGANNTITWNGIHHKTSMTGGPQNYGYPDPDYLKRVKKELKAKGIE
uniref:E3 ubiquitin-protein ligase n=1 Tax=Astyanax mexicanus TaxID=7994 RepID=A0A3B1KII0_ASTMX